MSLDGLRSRLRSRTIDVSNVPQSDKESSNPPGFQPGAGRAPSTNGAAGANDATEETPELYRRRTAALSTLSFSPLKQVGMTSFMMYMTGTNLHLYVPQRGRWGRQINSPSDLMSSLCSDSGPSVFLLP